MTTYSIIVFDDKASPPDINRPDIINIEAPWDLVEVLAKGALSRYPTATRAEARDENGHVRGTWYSGDGPNNP